MSSPRVWFITGASTGFGRSLLELLLQNGQAVVATLRKPEVLSELTSQYPEDKLLVLKVDVSNPADITAAFDKTKQVFGHLDIVFNNAGYPGSVGEVEAVPDNVARDQFEVNFWGAVNVSRAAIAFFREANRPGVGGTLLQMSSCAFYYPNPAFAYYNASKFALEGFSESLAKELDPTWNIKIHLLQLGAFHTAGLVNMVDLPVHPAYTNPSLITSVMRKNAPGRVLPGDADKATKVIYQLFADGGSEGFPLRIPLGKDSIAALRKKVGELTTGVDKVEKYSDDLLRD